MLQRSDTADGFADVFDEATLVERVAGLDCTPGWIPREKPLTWPAPRPEAVPAHWRYASIRPGLLAAGRVIGTDQAERRNLVLRNPVPGNDFATTRTLVGAYQSILPGERARAHRHSAHALRVILEAHGAFSVVDGVRHPMETGDIVLTPGGSWHGHGHDGNAPAYWFDCLDLPLVHLLEPMTAEDHPLHWEEHVLSSPDSPMRMTWASTTVALDAAPDDFSGMFGTTADLSSVLMPTISIRVHRWHGGWAGRPFRHYANTLYVVLQGAGTSDIGGHRFEWAFGDVLAAPMGVRLAHTARSEAVVVALSDEALMRYCGYYRLEACD